MHRSSLSPFGSQRGGGRGYSSRDTCALNLFFQHTAKVKEIKELLGILIDQDLVV